MPTESDLRNLLRDPDPGSGGIDVDAVLRRARARRRPRVVAASAIGSLALVGVLVPATLPSLLGGGSPSVMVAEDSGGDAADSDAAAPESAAGGSELSSRPPVTFAAREAPWRIEVAGSALAGDPIACTTDAAVAVSESDGAGVPIAVELRPGSTREDASRVADCLAGVLSGGAITVTGPN